ncbi:hypothetical protein AB835_13400 [Candidatus Endobugula sertula]|uniref:Thioesterase domain-containing protein n=1 Tax=Candidatus Endobugula sertula TaxID=62101 RepID=A0A1D2QLX6_9GAMM|nr:hypothetical protein AB835_13400 [Candidatus Endobugula sertula]
MGCKICFELARYFSTIGQPPKLLFLMASPSPDSSGGWRISQSNDEELSDGLKRLGGTPDNVMHSPKIMQTIMTILRADGELLEAYQAAKTDIVDVDTVLVIAEDDSIVSVPSMLRWQQHLAADIKIHRVVGDHFFMLEQYQKLQVWLIEALQK